MRHRLWVSLNHPSVTIDGSVCLSVPAPKNPMISGGNSITGPLRFIGFDVELFCNRCPTRNGVGRLVPPRPSEKSGQLHDSQTGIHNDSVFVNGSEHRHCAKVQKIDRIVKNRPVKLFPLSEQSAAVRMLFLNSAQQNEFTRVASFSGLFVPDWHVLTTAGSPCGR